MRIRIGGIHYLYDKLIGSRRHIGIGSQTVLAGIMPVMVVTLQLVTVADALRIAEIQGSKLQSEHRLGMTQGETIGINHRFLQDGWLIVTADIAVVHLSTYYIYRILQTGGMDTFRLISKDSFLAPQPYLPILDQSRRRFLKLDIRETVGIVEMLDAV